MEAVEHIRRGGMAGGRLYHAWGTNILARGNGETCQDSLGTFNTNTLLSFHWQIFKQNRGKHRDNG